VSGHGEQQSVEQEYDDRQTRAQIWEAATPKQRQVGGAGDSLLTTPDNEVQKGGGIAEFWYLDDGDILCDPELVLPYLQAFDVANPCTGAERNLVKTEVIAGNGTGDSREPEQMAHTGS